MKRTDVDAVPVVVLFVETMFPVKVPETAPAFTVLAVMVPVAVKVPTVVEPWSAEGETSAPVKVPVVPVIAPALIVFAVMVPVAVRVPTVVEPKSALFAIRLVVAVKFPKVAFPVFALVGVPQPNVPPAKVYWTKVFPVQSPSPLWEKRPRMPRSVVVLPRETMRLVEDAEVVKVATVPVTVVKVAAPALIVFAVIVPVAVKVPKVELPTNAEGATSAPVKVAVVPFSESIVTLLRVAVPVAFKVPKVEVPEMMEGAMTAPVKFPVTFPVSVPEMLVATRFVVVAVPETMRLVVDAVPEFVRVVA